MKKKIQILMVPVLCMGAVSCQNDDLDTPQLQVVKSEAYFQAKASEGYIVVSQSGNFTATSSETWCQITCKEDSVLLKVDNNTSIEGRTAVISIQSGEETQQVPVSQAGGYFRNDSRTDTFLLTNQAQETLYQVSTTFDYTASSDASWLTTNISEEGTLLNVSANTTNAPRYAQVSLYCTALNKTLVTEVYQYETQNFLGSWNAQWKDKNGNVQQKSIQISQNGNQLVLTGLQEGINIPVKAYGHSLAIETNSYAGKFNNQFDVYVCGVSEDMIIYAKEKETSPRSYYCSPKGNAEGMLAYPFLADSTLSDGKVMAGFALSAYKNNQNQGVITQFVDLELKK